MLNESQNKAFKKFSKLKVGALFMEMGTGKTRTALEIINYNIDNIDIVFWFTPFSTKNNLKIELKKWNFPIDIKIIGWESLSSSNKLYLDLLELTNNKNIFIVADESIFIKNGNTKRYNRLLNISKNSKYRLLLNGTPLTKSEWDIYFQMYFLSPKIINMSESEFRHIFYKKISYKKRGGKVNCFYKLNMLSSKDENKALEIAKFISNKKCILFYQYYQELDNILKYLKGNYLVINGSIKAKERNQILNDFELINVPLLISFGTGSYGLNLQHCNEIIFSSLTFDYSKILQAKARIRRIGQIQDIKYTYFDIDLPINKFISKNINNKAYLNDLLIKKLKEMI